MGEYLGKKISKMIDINQIDIVVPVPDTSKPVALEISKQLNKPYHGKLLLKIDMLIEHLS